MLVIDAAVSHLENLSCLEEYLCNLGKKHQAVGVKVESFSVRCPLLSHYDCVCAARPAALSYPHPSASTACIQLVGAKAQGSPQAADTCRVMLALSGKPFSYACFLPSPVSPGIMDKREQGIHSA